MNRPLFITIEGTDGSGKSTQARLLAERLAAAGHKVHTTFEPTGGHIGRLLRSILRGELKADQKAIAALFLADRLDHIQNENDGLLKMLADGYTVICDRYYFSSYAYHSVYVDMDWVIECNRMCAGMLRPDMTIFIDVPPEACMQRIVANREVPELYETTDILRKVRDNYLAAFTRLGNEEKVTIIDGNRAIDAVAADVGKLFEL
ncbi:dTMP kinase [Nemorincola caseinilytica]|uniref:Thymidylate kinase n=1 Tax=Nemorincola caseinilytica TaxID=2054315 RepID=A0ABP8NNM6_9BACT